MQFRNHNAIRRVAVLGAGVIGKGWISAYLARGFHVAVYDPYPAAEDQVRRHVLTSWDAMAQLDLCQANASPEHLSFHTTLAHCLSHVDLVQENTPEDLQSKTVLMREIDALTAPDVIIASSTSSLPISALQAQCRHPQRIVLGHPYNPVHLMPLVEVGGGESTDPGAIDALASVYISMRKHPIHVRKEIYGHITNRLASALFREAVWLVANGYATVGEIDDALRFGPALKWAIQGQFTSFHATGGDGGFANFLKHFSPGVMKRWDTMETPDLGDPAVQECLIRQLAEYLAGKTTEDVARDQDEQLVNLLRRVRSGETKHPRHTRPALQATPSTD